MLIGLAVGSAAMVFACYLRFPSTLTINVNTMLRIIISGVLLTLFCCGTSHAQIGSNRAQSGGTQVPTLDEMLVNNLRATLAEQQAFIRNVVQKTEQGQLEKGLVLAVMRYSQRRNERFPFPFFERAMRYQASKQGVALPSVATIVSSRTGLLR